MISGGIRKGKASVKKMDEPSKFLAITQDNAPFFARYEESSHGVYLVAFMNGHFKTTGNKRKWVGGQVCLVENLENVLWSRRLERPNDGAVSNNGMVAINDWLKMKQIPGGKFYIFDLFITCTW